MKLLINAEFLHRRSEDCLPDELESISKDLVEQIKNTADVWAIAAPQIGEFVRGFVMKVGNGNNILIFNPIVTYTKGSQVTAEKCLSLPNVVCKVIRPKEIKVKGINQYGNFVKYHFKGLQARIVCHEIDHLNGVLISDVEIK